MQLLDLRQGEVLADGRIWRVPKLALVSTLQAKLHDGSLKIAAALPEAKALAAELADFRVGYSGSGAMQFGARG